MLLHHPSLVKKPRARKYKPLTAQPSPPEPIPFKAQYNPSYMLIHYDLETTNLLNQNTRIVNVACELDTVLLEQWQRVNRGSSRCVYCDQKTDEATDIRPTVCQNCESKEEDEKEAKPHWFESLINPECKIPEAAQAVHAITDNMVKNAPKIKPVLIEMFKWIENLKTAYKLPRDFPVLLNAYNNFNFDQVVLQWELLRSELLVPANIYFGDLYFTLMNSFGTREQGEMSLEKVVQRICLRKGFKQQHTSMIDVESLMDVIHAFIDRQDLYDYLFQDRQRPFVEKQLREAIGSSTSSKQKQKQSNASNSNSNEYQHKNKKQKQRK
jgi:Fe-S-cluster containining protein